MLSLIVFLPLAAAAVLALWRLPDPVARWGWVGVTVADLGLVAVAIARYDAPPAGGLAFEERLRWIPSVNSSYLLLPVAVAGRTEAALPSLLLYLGGYAVSNLAAFAVIAAVPDRCTVADHRGLAARSPGLAAALVVSLLSLVGTPPTAVLMGKLTVFTAAWDGGDAWLVVLAAVNSVASLFYYLRWIAPAYQRDDERPAAGDRRMPFATAAALLAGTCVLLFGLAVGGILPLVTGSLAR